MNRYELYTHFKEILQKNGSIPRSENQYNALMADLIDYVHKMAGELTSRRTHKEKAISEYHI